MSDFPPVLVTIDRHRSCCSVVMVPNRAAALMKAAAPTLPLSMTHVALPLELVAADEESAVRLLRRSMRAATCSSNTVPCRRARWKRLSFTSTNDGIKRAVSKMNRDIACSFGLYLTVAASKSLSLELLL